ncbi:hypothetical protein JC221_236 [Yersinia phage JC221]|nr:hypothetical protein JC221_236 [Yersinia phage JC221]
MKTKTIINYSVIALIIGALAYAGVQQAKQYKQAPFRQNVLETQREAEKTVELEKIKKQIEEDEAAEAEKKIRRERSEAIKKSRANGDVFLRTHKNAFDEVSAYEYFMYAQEDLAVGQLKIYRKAGDMFVNAAVTGSGNGNILVKFDDSPADSYFTYSCDYGRCIFSNDFIKNMLKSKTVKIAGEDSKLIRTYEVKNMNNALTLLEKSN